MGVTYLGLDFDQRDAASIAGMLGGRSAADRFAYLVTPNVDHIVRLAALDPNDALWAAYQRADWRLCDSRVLAALAFLRGIDLPAVPGSDLIADLIRAIAEPGDRICLIGGVVGDSEALAALRPDLTIVQHIPPLGLRDNPAARADAARFAARSGGRFTLIAVGSPQQELIAAAIKEMPEARGTGLCIGASIDFLLGRERRAPRWMQRLSLEWLYRLLANPRRMWRRYLVEGPRIFLLAWRFQPPIDR